MLPESTISALARQLYDARKSRTQLRHFSKAHPGMTVEDGYAIQRAWVALEVADGRTIKGRKIGLTSRAMQMASKFNEPDFGFLFNRKRRLFHIGFRVAEHQLDGGFYDLLASEARATSLWAIAKGDVPVSHWFHLGRPMTPVGIGSALLSWSGSMFEYLMPELVLNVPTGSLLEQTDRLVVAHTAGA